MGGGVKEFRERARAWIAENLPEEWRAASAETHGEDTFLDIRRQFGRRLAGLGVFALDPLRGVGVLSLIHI